MIFRKKKSSVGFVIDWKFHEKGGWVSSFAPHLVEAIIREFNPIILTSQLDYEWYKSQLKFIISMEPGWAAPKIKFKNNQSQLTCMMLSDPHSKTDWLQRYIDKKNVDLVLSQYFNPFYYHFPSFDERRFVHFPWAVADNFLSSHKISQNNTNVVAFGGAKSGAYDVRNWCKEQDCVTSHDNSGVENKIYSDEGYFKWLSTLDAIVAAGSSNPKYDLVTPKYFEICSAGSLLFGQNCKDLELLGFNEKNSVLFDQSNFLELVSHYRSSPADFISKRVDGRKLVAKKHLISHRISLLKELFDQVC